MQNHKSGWAWFGVNEETVEEHDKELALCFAHCFRGADGERVIGHLKAMTVEQALGPSADAALLRHLEGQRQLVAHILSLIERGRGNIQKS